MKNFNSSYWEKIILLKKRNSKWFPPKSSWEENAFLLPGIEIDPSP
jgi:hypothetical protein